MVFDFLAELLSGLADGTPDVPDTSGTAHPVHFGEGRWDGGTDRWGNEVVQSSTGDPYYPSGPNAGQPVDPKDVTWH
ncbi:hypothetical protein GCM10022243_67500 [Saccharothrix violaceirubra]|uniref:Uncharacterized protein n=1 Tax=Saccharothrix violaceirubra TaxID=413306 RepID=A0A7W7WVG0_9PSEU|nr:hypothetical protein [Saccharothrix violaceirubra]MBB4965299.1 hypothetical protein [Saccharothrix violaceirubra]